jgi:hypothetical protein
MQEAELFRLFVKFFGCGSVYIRPLGLPDGIVQDLDFKEGLSIIDSGLHLNRGRVIAQFKAIKEDMNNFRST